MLDVFHTLAEVSVAVTGFSSLIIIFRGSSVPWEPLDYIHFGFVLAWTIGCIFLSLLPILFVEFGVGVETAARVGLIAAVGYVIAVGAVLTRAQNRAAATAEEMPPAVPRIVMTVFVMIFLVVSILAATGLLGGALRAWYALAIVALLAIATADLGIFVVQSTRKQD